jgi:superfamily II DNA/RNA helicase
MSAGRGRGRGKKGDFIDEARFINKAIPRTEEIYTPKNTFMDFNVATQLAQNIAAKGFIYPSPIQDQSIPVALTGRDIIGIASTGTGKTAAFLIPIINQLVLDHNAGAVVLAPTRELAQQIEEEFRSLTRGMNFFSVSCVGGAPIGRQMRELERGVHVIIGTPGRVKDLIARGKINMQHYQTVVLDEADRMLDMGFIDDMRYILGLMKAERQTLFFSATFSPEIKKLCHDFLHDPVTVAIPSRDTATSVEQNVVRFTDRADKLERLHELLIKPEISKVLIFRETKRSVDELTRELKGRGFTAHGLHGDMHNRERERAVKALAKGDAQIVIATDVAARGIDIPDITHVINYDIPSTYDTYVHRIGRTGRGTKMGHALTFVPNRM